MESKNGLTAAEMEVVRAVFQTADEETTVSFMNEEEHMAVQEFRWAMAYGSKPYLMVGGAGLADILNTVNGSKIILSYVFDLYGKFTSRWAESDEAIHALHNNLARAFSLQNPSKGALPDTNATHPKILERLSTKEDIVKLLDNTPWLTVILLQNIYPNVKIRAMKPNQRRVSAQDQTA